MSYNVKKGPENPILCICSFEYNSLNFSLYIPLIKAILRPSISYMPDLPKKKKFGHISVIYEYL